MKFFPLPLVQTSLRIREPGSLLSGVAYAEEIVDTFVSGKEKEIVFIVASQAVNSFASTLCNILATNYSLLHFEKDPRRPIYSAYWIKFDKYAPRPDILQQFIVEINLKVLANKSQTKNLLSMMIKEYHLETTLPDDILLESQRAKTSLLARRAVRHWHHLRFDVDSLVLPESVAKNEFSGWWPPILLYHRLRKMAHGSPITITSYLEKDSDQPWPRDDKKIYFTPNYDDPLTYSPVLISLKKTVYPIYLTQNQSNVPKVEKVLYGEGIIDVTDMPYNIFTLLQETLKRVKKTDDLSFPLLINLPYLLECYDIFDQIIHDEQRTSELVQSRLLAIRLARRMTTGPVLENALNLFREKTGKDPLAMISQREDEYFSEILSMWQETPEVHEAGKTGPAKGSESSSTSSDEESESSSGSTPRAMGLASQFSNMSLSVKG